MRRHRVGRYTRHKVSTFNRHFVKHVNHIQAKLFRKNKQCLQSAEHVWPVRRSTASTPRNVGHSLQTHGATVAVSYRNIQRAPHQHRLNIVAKSLQIRPDSSFLRFAYIDLLKTKRNLLYIRNQSVPRSKHFPPRL